MVRVIATNVSEMTDMEYRLLYEMASAERKEKAGKYHCRKDAIHCVVADALLRYAMGASTYTVEKTVYGKPFVPGNDGFRYNLSHAGDWVVLAFGSAEVGVDVEEICGNINIDAIVCRFFSPEEQRYVRENSRKRLHRFYEVWVGKESYIKYLGTGLNLNLETFSMFDLKSNVRPHSRMLDDRHIMSLCTCCDDYRFEELDISQLLRCADSE